MTDGEVIEKIGVAVRRKKSALGGHEQSTDLVNSANRPMILIGG